MVILKNVGSLKWIRRKEKGIQLSQFCVDGVRITEHQLIAKKLKKYFASIASTLNEQVDWEIEF